MSSVRGRGHLKLLDRYAGVPALAVLGLRRKRPFPKDVRHIGLMKTAAIGDTTLLAGLVDDVKATFPQARLTMVTGFDNAGVVPLLGRAIDGAITVSPGQVEASVRSLRRLDLDVLADFGAWPRFDALLAALSGARYSIGFRTPGQFRHYAYDASVAHSGSAHERDNYVTMVRAMGVVTRTEPRLSSPNVLDPSRIPRGGFAVFHPWSSGYRHEVKEWSDDRWISLASAVAPRVGQVVITGAGAEVPRSRALTERMQSAGVSTINMAGQLSLPELADLLAASDVVVSVNTGVAHLAGLVGARTVSLEGPTPPARWAPLGPRTRTVVTTLAGSGYLNLGFEYRGQRLDCMEGISVGAVAEAVFELTSDEMCESSRSAQSAHVVSHGSDRED
jgi:ADP-heptose:LPS heptosyltransferase